MEKIILLVLLLTTLGSAQIFQQDFSSSSTVSDYVSASAPNSGQWNAISTSGAGTVVSVVSNTLVFARTGNAGSFSRTTDFSPIPTGMIYKFDLSVSGNTTAQTTAAVLQVGSNYGTANSSESNANTYARLAINFTSTTGTFQIRDITNSTNSSDFSGIQSFTWALNNTGNSTSYTAPDGSTENIGNDKADLWAGNTLIFNDVNIQTSTQSLSDLKFAFSAGNGSITFDNFIIYGATDGSLPVELSSFTANASAKSVTLNWVTATEVNNHGFEVQKAVGSGQSATWEKIAFVAGNGNSNSTKNYSYTDNSVNAGKYSYRLKQIDNDGKFEYSKVVEVDVNAPLQYGLAQNYPNPFNPATAINFTLPEAQFVTLKIYNVLGQEVKTLINGMKEAGVHTINFEAKNLNSGLYFYKLEAGSFSSVRKMMLTK